MAPPSPLPAGPRLKRVVIKLGTGVLTSGIGQLNTARIADVCEQIATLRALGFQPPAVLVSVLIEALVLGLLGGCAGGALAFVAFNGFQASTLNFQSFSQITFAFTVTPALLALGIGYALVLGLLGGLLPGLKAARQPVSRGLREL
jgi:putative ABC transport system permease protein